MARQKVAGMMSNARCREVFAGAEFEKCCGNCRYYDAGKENEEPACGKNEICTNFAALCSEWEKKTE